MGVISNAMNILGVDTNVQTIITGAIIVGAVVLSNINNIKKRNKRRKEWLPWYTSRSSARASWARHI